MKPKIGKKDNQSVVIEKSDSTIQQAKAKTISPVDFSTGSNIVISVEDLWKQYRLGTINHGTLAKDLQSWWARARGKEDPNLKIDHSVKVSEDSTEGERDRFWALKDISFDIKLGDVLGIIGKNGAGKSTLLKILSQVTTPTKGEIKIKGRVASLLEVGTGFHPELTGRENIFLNGAILGMSKVEIRSKFDEIVDFAEIEKFLDTPVKRYSSGMYVRLAFAVAAHLEPEILIVDEVLAVGDAQFQKKCLGKMEEVGKAGRTVLFVSHNMAAIQNLCQQSILIENGELVFVGGTETAVEKYLTTASALQNMIVPGVYDLQKRKNPHGQGLIVKRLFFKGHEDYKTNFRMGEEFCVEVEVSGLFETPSVEVGIVIKDKYGKWITSINSGMLGGFDTYRRSKYEKIKFKTEALKLTADRYFVDITVAQRGVGRVDFVENAGEFSVVSSDVYGTGYELTSYFGYFYMDAKLSLINLDNC